MSGQSRRAPNRPGAHYLTDRRVIADLVRSAAVQPGDLVVDVGAGAGALTGPLARTGAHVIAVERDPALAAALRRRFDASAVRVVCGDLRTVALPDRPYRVVANPPFAVTTALLRRLLDDPRGRLLGADVLVESGFACRVTAAVPRDLATAWWSARFEARVMRPVPAGCFSPAPRVDAAHLRIRPRPISRSVPRQRVLRALLTAAYRGRRPTVRAVLGDLVSDRAARQVLRQAGPDAPAANADPTGLTRAQWSALAAAVDPSRTPAARSTRT